MKYFVLSSRLARGISSSHILKFGYATRNENTPSHYCLDLVRKNDHENFLCTLLLPNDIRGPAFAIRAFNIEVARVADQTRETHIALMRMNFWNETLDNIYKGKAPKHPVAQELSRVVSKHKLLKRNLTRLVKARINQLAGSTFETMDKMEAYAEETVSPIYYLLLEVAGIKNLQADHAGSHLGKAQGVATLLRAIPHNASQRELLLPQDVLLKYNISQESVLRGKSGKPFRDAVFDIASGAKIHLDKSRSMRKSIPKEAYSVFLPAVSVDTFLENLRRVDFDIFSPKITSRNSSLGFRLYWNKFVNRY